MHVVISLDGNKENHDRNRKFPNGDGTFDAVYGNIKRFQEKYPAYRKKAVVSVYDCKTDIVGNVDFFENNDLPPLIFLAEASHQNTTYWNRFSDEDKSRFWQTMKRVFDQYFESMKHGRQVPRYLAALFRPRSAKVLLRHRHADISPFITPYTANCTPGMKISVRTDGTFDMCERVNATFPMVISLQDSTMARLRIP